MPTVKAVEHALLRAGERRATPKTSGFRVKSVKSGTVVVSWCGPSGESVSGAGIAFLEAYAPILRAAGICAVVTTDALEPRVLCLPGPVIGGRASAPGEVLDAS